MCQPLFPKRQINTTNFKPLEDHSGLSGFQASNTLVLISYLLFAFPRQETESLEEVARSRSVG